MYRCVVLLLLFLQLLYTTIQCQSYAAAQVHFKHIFRFSTCEQCIIITQSQLVFTMLFLPFLVLLLQFEIFECTPFAGATASLRRESQVYGVSTGGVFISKCDDGVDPILLLTASADESAVFAHIYLAHQLFLVHVPVNVTPLCSREKYSTWTALPRPGTLTEGRAFSATPMVAGCTCTTRLAVKELLLGRPVQGEITNKKSE
jgi:hypothetical protein